MNSTKRHRIKYLLAGAVVMVGVVIICLLWHPKQAHLKTNSIKLPYPAGEITINPKAPSGELAYLSPFYSTSQKSDFLFDLFLQKINPTRQAAAPVTRHRFPSNDNYGVTGCDFSPSGKQILLKFHAPSEPTDVYVISVWNRDTQHMQPGPIMGLRYPPTYWSPDGKYLAYIQGGGDADGREVLAHGDWNQDDPAILRVFNIATGNSQTVVQHPILNSIAWMSPNTLLFSVADQSMPLLFMRPEWVEQPNIYSYSVSAGSSTQLIIDGFNPAASPDGKSIAFIGWPALLQHSKKDQSARATTPASAAFGVYLYNLQQKTRLLIYPIKSPTERDQLLWTPDNKNLLLLRVLYQDTSPGYMDTDHPNGDPGYGEGHFILINTASKMIPKENRELAVVKTVDTRARINPATLFQFRGFSKIGKSLFFSTSEVVKDSNVDASGPGTYDRLRRLDLTNGSLQDVYTGTNLSSLGWHECGETDCR